MRTLNRRVFMQMGGLGLAGLLLPHRELAVSQESVTPLGTANACIFIKLLGGPSHVDTFDLKVGPWTPSDFDVTAWANGQISRRLFPQLAQRSQQVAVVRSCRAWGLEHNQAHYALMAGRKFNPGFVSEIPHIGSVAALEFALRGQTGPFPPFISFNGAAEIESGFLQSTYSPFTTAPMTPNITHPAGIDRFRKRWNFLQRLDRTLRQENAPQGPAFMAYQNVYLQAKGLTHLQPFEEAFAVPQDERERYGASLLGDACIVARKILAANKGTRFIVINHNGDSGVGWDHHTTIYSQERLPYVCRELDNALGALLADMQGIPATPAQPARDPSLFDKTLIIVMGEFGRTPSDRYEGNGLNNTSGRDHWAVNSALFAGGGVRGGRMMGATDANGATIVDFGWDKGRPVTIEDIAATIYSALGINWTKEIRETPSGRAFRYTPSSAEFGRHEPVQPLFLI
jgi:hypothetical protein